MIEEFVTWSECQDQAGYDWKKHWEGGLPALEYEWWAMKDGVIHGPFNSASKAREVSRFVSQDATQESIKKRDAYLAEYHTINENAHKIWEQSIKDEFEKIFGKHVLEIFLKMAKEDIDGDMDNIKHNLIGYAKLYHQIVDAQNKDEEESNEKN